MCLGQTCGNGVCDAGETYETCLADCAPPAADATLTRKGDIFACEAESSVAQWLVDGEPFYALHFTFDQPYARDDSAHGMNPGQAVGADIRAPSPAQVDGRGVFAFDAASRLVGNTSQALELTGDEFSLFAALKITQTASAEQTIFALDAGGRIRFGLDEGKLFFEGEPVRAPATATIVGQGCLSGQCLFMQHNDATWQGVRQQVGQLLPGQVYTLTVSFKTTASHNGYINLYDRSWGRSCGGSGKSFTARAFGSGQWQELSVQVTIPMLDDCGDSTADDDWWVYLYGHDPVGDNSPVYYDDAILLHDAGNLLDNPSFEEGMEPWLPASYAPPLRLAGNQTLSPGVWHTVGLVYQRPNLRLYVDGVTDGEGSVELVGVTGDGSYAIGATDANATEGLFRGYLDDLFLTDHALNPDQIAQYHATLHKTLRLPNANSALCILSVDNGYARVEISP